MLNHIKLNRNGPLSPAFLNDLGRINVVCGKNNSGKSTLLNAIADGDKRLPGVFVSKDNLTNAISTYALQHHAFSSNSRLNPRGRDFASAANSIEEGVWYLDEKEKFIESIKSACGKYPNLYSTQIPPGHMAGIFDRFFATIQTNSVLIPPKRNIDVLTNISNSPVAPDGKGLLNYLFFSLNQEEGTAHREHFDKIQAAFIEISSGFKFRMVQNDNAQVSLRFRNQKNVSADAMNCGLGLQDLLVILYFATTDDLNLVLIEEPESHLHPEMQRKLLGFISSLSNKQFFLATHSNVFLDSAFADKVFLTQAAEEITLRDETNRATILSELGYQVTDNLVSDLIVLVEGPSDIPVYERFLLAMGIIPKFQIKFWPLGGDIMSQLDLSIFTEKYRIIAIVDRDPGSKPIRDRFKEKCDQLGIQVNQLERYAIENYFTVNALRSVYKNQISENISELDPNIKLEKQIGFDVKARTRNIARAMEISDIANTDLHKVLQNISSLCNQ